MHVWMCGGSEEDGKEVEEVRGPAKPIAVAHGLWVRRQMSVEHTRYMYMRTYTEELLQGSGRAWVRSLSGKLLQAERRMI